ncbi:MAG: (d)CMP kinase [Candidatus Staskawiczbacteria bacterium]|nr:(d)CMP kinase [Candidatus Staskawiczbacteria bacterium]
MIIFINGPINSGKTTVAKILVKKLPNSALLEIDALYEMINWMPISKAVPINLENAVSIIKNFLKNQLDIIVPYPLSQKNYDYMTEELKDLKEKMYFFTLSPKLEKALINRGSRKIYEKEKDRIKYHYEIGINAPNFGEIIDNSEQSPKETAKIILDKINKKL